MTISAACAGARTSAGKSPLPKRSVRTCYGVSSDVIDDRRASWRTVAGIKLAGLLPKSRREALQQGHWPGPLADVVGQIHATLFAVLQVVELRGGEASRFLNADR